MRRFFDYISIYSKRAKKDHISEYAAECAYYTILSFIPFIMLCLSLIKYINLDINSMYSFINEFIPTTAQSMLTSIINEVYDKSFGTISIAILFALWSSSRGFYCMSKGIRHIYRTKKSNKSNILIRFEGIIYTIVFIMLIISVLVLRVFGNTIYRATLGRFDAVSNIIYSILRFRFVLIIFLLFSFFVILYKVIPRNKEKALNQILGASFSSIVWYLLSWIFSIYIDVFKSFTNTYGSLTSIILIMMWVYACMYTILLGAEINVFYKKSRNKD